MHSPAHFHTRMSADVYPPLSLALTDGDVPHTTVRDGDTDTRVPASVLRRWRFWGEEALDTCLYPRAIPDPNQSTESTEASGRGILRDQPLIQT